MHWRRVLSFVLLSAFTVSLSVLAIYFVRDRRERNALRELGDRASERALALSSLLAEARSRGGLERVPFTALGRQAVVLDPGLAFVAHPALGGRRGVLLPVEVAEELQRGTSGPLLVQDYRDPLDATGARWLAAFAPAGRTGYLSAQQVRAPNLPLGTALWMGLALAALLWVLSSRKSRADVRP